MASRIPGFYFYGFFGVGSLKITNLLNKNYEVEKNQAAYHHALRTNEEMVFRMINNDVMKHIILMKLISF